MRDFVEGNVDFYVDPQGRIRDHFPWKPTGQLAAEAVERRAIASAARGRPLAQEASAEIGPCPARGPAVVFRDARVIPVGTEGFQVAAERYPSGAPVRELDVFDRMNNQALRRKGAIIFTPLQIGAARDYRALHERVQAAGMKCSRAFDLQAAGQGRRDFMDAYRADTQVLGWFHREIGDGMALTNRRHMDRGSRRNISVRALVDGVCIADQPLSAFLVAHGWAGGGKTQKALKAILGAALSRMECVSCVTLQNVVDS